MPDLYFELLDTEEALKGFVLRWTALHEADPNATPFQHPAWLLPWWRQFSSEELCAVAVFDRDTLRAFLPLYTYTEPETSERKLMLMGVGTSDYLDGVYAPGFPTGQLVQALRWLAERRTWDTLSLVQLRGGSPLKTALGEMGVEVSLTETCSALPACRIAELPSKIRRNAMYYGNAARRRGVLEVSVAGISDCIGRFDALVRLHTARWQERGEEGVLSDPRVLAWHREALPLLAGAGLLRLFTLTLAGETIAAMYAVADASLKENRTVYFYLPGFSMAHGDLRPGTLLMAAAIEHAVSEGIFTVDLLRGNEEYKQHWHAEPVATYGCSVAYARFLDMAVPVLEVSA